VAFAENGNWQLGTGAADAAFRYGVVPLPVGNSGKVYLGGEGEAIGAFSKHPDLAWQYLRETYFDGTGQLVTVRDVGSLPSRRDTAQDPAVVGNAQLRPLGGQRAPTDAADAAVRTLRSSIK
jgi:ABC-type glycerol-3-phosphate transport system substrate-binding protein